MRLTKHLLKALFIFITLFGFVHPALAQAGTVVSVEPDYLEVDPGETFSVDVVVTDVSSLWAFDIVVEFDPAIISFDHSEFGDFLDAGMAAPVVSEPGRISCGLTQVSPSSPKSGSGVLCTFTFIAEDLDGESHLDLVSVELVEHDSYNLIPTTNMDGFVLVGEPKAEVATYLPLIVLSPGK
ncbi:MAG: hypothetical protein H0S79_16660 [Anaerolineaceae bacterium]|nr:hypothetical protein [Anaerolineaceae bacterium]